MDWTRDYEVIMGSDVHADGMYLEARPRADHTRVVLFAFYSDADGSLTFEPPAAGLPPGFVAWFRAEAARRRPPADA